MVSSRFYLIMFLVYVVIVMVIAPKLTEAIVHGASISRLGGDDGGEDAQERIWRALLLAHLLLWATAVAVGIMLLILYAAAFRAGL